MRLSWILITFVTIMIGLGVMPMLKPVIAASPGDVLIVEVGADPASAAGISEPSGEFIEIFNNTTMTIDLSGWTLMDNGTTTITFPSINLLSHQRLVVIASSATLGTPNGYGCGTTPFFFQPAAWFSNNLSNDADRVILKDSMANTIDALSYGTDTTVLNPAAPDVEDVYNEFSYGQKTPQALKDFLSYAASNWRRAPRFVLLVGDASLDPKNYLGQGDYDFVPTKIIDTLAMETASDDWLTDFDGNDLANMAMGRLPVRTLQEANIVIGKIISYDQGAPTDGVLLVTDNDADYNFQAINPQMRALIPDRLRVQEMLRDSANQPAAKSDLLASLNRGQKIVNYYGHGSLDQWSGDYLTSSDALGLTNRDSLTLFLSVTCLNGYFQDPAVESLAESLLKADQGGAAAVWASSGMCDAASQAIINLEMFRLLFGDTGAGQLTLGEAALRAKSVVPALDTRRTYILFGDPTTRLK